MTCKFCKEFDTQTYSPWIYGDFGKGPLIRTSYRSMVSTYSHHMKLCVTHLTYMTRNIWMEFETQQFTNILIARLMTSLLMSYFFSWEKNDNNHIVNIIVIHNQYFLIKLLRFISPLYRNQINVTFKLYLLKHNKE